MLGIEHRHNTQRSKASLSVGANSSLIHPKLQETEENRELVACEDISVTSGGLGGGGGLALQLLEAHSCSGDLPASRCL